MASCSFFRRASSLPGAFSAGSLKISRTFSIVAFTWAVAPSWAQDRDAETSAVNPYRIRAVRIIVIILRAMCAFPDDLDDSTQSRHSPMGAPGTRGPFPRSRRRGWGGGPADYRWRERYPLGTGSRRRTHR